MTICKDCNTPMQPVMTLSKDKTEKFNKCPKCHGAAKHVKLRDNDMEFG